MGNLIFKYSAISFLVLLALVGGSLWVFGDKAQLTTERPTAPIAVLRTEELSSIGSTEGKQTLTQTIAEQISEQILRNNPEGPEEGKGLLALNPAVIVDEALAAEMAAASAANLRPLVDESKLNILTTTNRELATRYFTDVYTLFQKNVAGLRVNRQDLFATDFQEFNSGLTAMIDGLYRLPVPSDLVDFHIQQIEVFGEQRSIYTALQNFKIDPVTGYIALHQVNPLREEMEEMQVWEREYQLANNIVI